MTQGTLPIEPLPEQVEAAGHVPSSPASAASSPAGAALPIDLAEVTAEIQNEIGWRHEVYARRVADQKMSQAQADRKIAIMQRTKQIVESVMENGPFIKRCLRFRRELEECLVILEKSP